MHLLFDLDGTLADPLEGFANSLFFAFDRMSLERPSLDTVRACVGPPLNYSIPNVLGIQDPVEMARLLEFYREHHGQEGIFQYRFYPWIEETLMNLHPHASLYVATSKPVAYARTILERFGKAHFFKGIYGSEFTGERSAKADLIAYILATEKLSPSSTLMIGDREFDVLGARRNGVRAIGVTWGYGSREELERAGASWICGNMRELIRTCEELK